MPACDLGYHLADLRAVERRERNDAIVRAHGPGRAELRPRRRHDERRRPPAVAPRIALLIIVISYVRGVRFCFSRCRTNAGRVLGESD